ncbi:MULTISPECIES: hypothetical protein [Brenneria]|uniref:Uncharacterized protein n=1 Tax=Brenneria nigrifluens DSM 30175 = ATCC 13028 TaxID=1121120 RepID=A0A2U1UPJ6_9GAMM|nr:MULTISPECIES: hypothetical protein [Brenneria]EHD23242.1 hypothetical protein BrE312_3905 [Brenneria sp. EniD312]PWC23521.1 hypothetical protein DDT54_14345 [Brenneria nigrifluens DSM 30175 = ATCC 13028]QCR06175.1 hypothetical protein EH206_19650 [Brenneria nigrifluens DSM 30175 = ATCC 13028]
MNISGISTEAWAGIGRSTASKQNEDSPQGVFADLLRTQTVASQTDKVTISDAAKKMSNAEGASTQGRTLAQEETLRVATLDSASAEKLAYDMAYVSSAILFDISDQLASGISGPVNKLSSTGRIIDEDFKENFSREASAIDAQRRAIYETEKAKGTPATEILAKMFDFTNQQSKSYLEATGSIEQAVS